jgi:SAM-dependent methyltransferase
MARVSSPDFWQELYTRGGDGWDLGRPTPPLVDFVETTPPPAGHVLVPGCGRGHDARFLAGRGYSVVGVDFSPAALEAARALARRDEVDVTFEDHDLFALDRVHPRGFDGVWEYTCYCAIDPARRAEYVRVMAAVVRPGGWFLGCFFPLQRISAGPPFQVSAAVVRRQLGRAFRIERAFPPPRSARGRQGREWMVFARRTAGVG